MSTGQTADTDSFEEIEEGAVGPDAAVREAPQGTGEASPGSGEAQEGVRPIALVVDDDGAIRRMLRDVLEGPFEVAVAVDGESALEQLAARDFDLIVTDNMMPGMNGVDLLERSLELRPDAVRFLVTASREAEHAVEAVNRAEVDRFFIKPVRLTELRREALETVRQRRAERDLRARLASLSAIEAGQSAVVPRILLATGDAEAAWALEQGLEAAGFPLTSTRSGRDALDHLGARRFDLLVVGLDLEEVSGVEVMRLARKLYPDVEVVAVAPKGADELERSGERVYHVIHRPFDEAALLPGLAHRALERQALGRERERLLVDLVETNHRLRRTNTDLREAQERLRHKVAELDLLQDATVMSLTRLAEYRDLETGDHLERMRNYARIAAEALRGEPGFEEVDDRFVEAIYKAAPLHDIGKVGIPDRILCKPGRLTSDEWKVMRTHPAIGGETLAEAERRAGEGGPTGLLRMGKHIAWHHHERWDGGGYPKGLAGDAIPPEARIVTVVDAYDAITSRRVYKPSYSHAHAVGILLEERDKHFDARVVDAFLSREADILAIRARWSGNEVELV